MGDVIRAFNGHPVHQAAVAIEGLALARLIVRSPIEQPLDILDAALAVLDESPDPSDRFLASQFDIVRALDRDAKPATGYEWPAYALAVAGGITVVAVAVHHFLTFAL